MSKSVDFIYEEFEQAYPELKANEVQAKWAFDMACLIMNNTPNSVVCCLCERKQLLYLLAAHILFLKNRGAGNVGAINNAHEGSVGVGYGGLGKLGESYFGQSQYGTLFWQLVAPYLSGFYVP